MSQFLLLELVLFVVTIMAVVRVWRASVLHGVLTLLVPLYVIVSMIRYWKDPDHDIRWHVLVLVLGGGLAFWMQQRLVHQYLAEQAAVEAALRDTANAGDDDDDDGDDADDADAAPGATTPGVTIEIGPASRLAERQRRVAVAAAKPEPRRTEPARARAVTHEARASEPSIPAESAAAAPPTLSQALAAATFQRGRFERASSGFAIDLPAHFHALAAVDARRLEASLGQTSPPREVAWVLHENVAPGAPGSWHVSVRWLDDGWSAAPGADIDAAQWLRDAQRAEARSRRLLGSGGVLVGWAVAPQVRDGVVDWVEERVPDEATASVLDCHAVRAGRKGVVEFSIVGIAAGSQALCDSVVRLLADNVRFDGDLGYPPDPPDGAHAPYSLHDLVAHRR